MRHTGEEIAFLTDLLAWIGEERDAMTVVELDGFVAGLVLCPERVGPSEWLPLVWGGERASEDVEESVDATLAVMDHYRRVAEDLACDPQGYRTVFGLDPKSGVLLWEPWVWGFRQAKDLRPEAWLQVGASGDEKAMASLAMIETMNDIGEGVSDLPRNPVEELRRSASDLIRDCVRALAAWALSRAFGGGLAMVAERGGLEPGGGEPCPCGSGRTYECCCGVELTERLHPGVPCRSAPVPVPPFKEIGSNAGGNPRRSFVHGVVRQEQLARVEVLRELPDVGDCIREKPLGLHQQPPKTERPDRRGGRRAVVGRCPAHLLPRGGGERPDVAPR